MRHTTPEIEIRHLRYFIAATDAGSFRKAAAALGVQESSVSRRIRDVEDQIGASLFVRHSGGINLTMAGQRFLHRAVMPWTTFGTGLQKWLPSDGRKVDISRLDCFRPFPPDFCQPCFEHMTQDMDQFT
ncbi:LysR family transcriptional regulator [Xanthobacter wiegelii]|uniref:LysR family transcriptional regulator n=1 Tax=Xanthobacter wiegelii TaxID=3119913 RepID=UPI003736B56D